MRLIVCLDLNGGMAFNKRRQTRDVVQRRHMNEVLRGEVLLMSPYSEKLFREELTDVSIVADEERYRTLIGAGSEGFEGEWPDNLFVERESVEALLDKADEIMVYQWNRSYPSDVRFPMERLSAYSKVREESFAGSSHDDIMFEVYRR